MARRYTYETTLSFGGDVPTAELEVTFSYTVIPGRPEQGPSYSHGGLPAEPAEIDDIRVETIDGRARPWNTYLLGDDALADMLLAEVDDDDLYAAMLEESAESAAADRDAADEARWEDLRQAREPQS